MIQSNQGLATKLAFWCFTVYLIYLVQKILQNLEVIKRTECGRLPIASN